MAVRVLVRRSLTAGLVPTTSNLLDGELSVNVPDKKIYVRNGASVVNILDWVAPLASPAFTGTPTVPTAATATNNTQAASTAFVRAAIAAYTPPTDLSNYVTLNTPQTISGEKGFEQAVHSDVHVGVFKPATSVGIGFGETLSGYMGVYEYYSGAGGGFLTPPTDLFWSQNGTVVFDVTPKVGNNAIYHAGNLNLGTYAPLASPAFTGTPTVPTAATSTNDTQVASTAFVRAAISAYSPVPANMLTTNTAQTISALKTINRGTNTADNGIDLLLQNGAAAVQLHARLSSGSYNPLVQTADKGIIFTDGTTGTGSLFIGPWSTSSHGLRLAATGANTLGGSLTISNGLSVSAGGSSLYGGVSAYGGLTSYNGTLGTSNSASGGDGASVDITSTAKTGSAIQTYKAFNLGTGYTPGYTIYGYPASGGTAPRFRIRDDGGTDFLNQSGVETLTITSAGVVSCNDITASRGNGTGVIFLGGSTRYLFYTGSYYQLAGAGLDIGGGLTINGGLMEMTSAGSEFQRANANSTTKTRQPRIFVQSTDPGAAAADGDLWFW